MIKKKVRKILGIPKETKAKIAISSLADGDYLIGDIPYQCQFASPKLAASILEGKIKARDDPDWAIFGFKTRNESEFWAWRDCGICCVKMVLDFYGIKVSIAELVKRGLILKGYDMKRDFGWYYKPLVNLAKEYGINGFTTSYLGKNEVAARIFNKRFVIASVNPSIIRFDEKVKSRKKRGHLVLVIGFKIKKGKIIGFYINNPSGDIYKTQKKAFVPIEIFNDAFGEQGIVLGK